MAQPVHYPSFQSALVQRGVLNEAQLQLALSEAGKLPLERFLVQNKTVATDVLTLAIAAYFNNTPITLPPSIILPGDLIELAPIQLWLRLKAAPLMKLGKRLTVAFGDPFDLMAQEEVARADRVITQIMGYAQLSEGRVEKLNVVEELDRAICQVLPAAVPTVPYRGPAQW